MPLCSWCGIECDCKEFPWTEDGVIPLKCEKLIQTEMPYLISVRKVRDTDAAKWIAICEAKMREEKKQAKLNRSNK